MTASFEHATPRCGVVLTTIFLSVAIVAQQTPSSSEVTVISQQASSRAGWIVATTALTDLSISLYEG
jgi:hypothetical protein